MVSVSSSSDLQQMIPVRPTRPIAPRQQPQQDQDQQQNDQIVDKNNQKAVTSDEEIARAVRAYEQDRQQQKQFSSDQLSNAVIENGFEDTTANGYSQTGFANAGETNIASARGQYIDIYA